jgi:hypothetical protein
VLVSQLYHGDALPALDVRNTYAKLTLLNVSGYCPVSPTREALARVISANYQVSEVRLTGEPQFAGVAACVFPVASGE